MTSPARLITSSVILRSSPRPVQERITRAPAPAPKVSSSAHAVNTPTLEAGKVLLKKGALWLDDLRAEMLAFPYCKHDDQLDALSQLAANRTALRARPD